MNRPNLPAIAENWNLTALTVKQAAIVLNCSTSLIYRDIKKGILEHDLVGKNGKRFNYWDHLLPYLKREQKKRPRPRQLSTRKANLKHLDTT